MTVPVNSDAARSPHEPAEAAQHDGSHRSRRTIMTERDLAELEVRLALEACFDLAEPEALERKGRFDRAELEARLELEACFELAELEARPKHDLQHSPSIAAPNGEVERPRYDTGSLSRQTPWRGHIPRPGKPMRRGFCVRLHGVKRHPISAWSSC
jgi:hypothetical protein